MKVGDPLGLQIAVSVFLVGEGKVVATLKSAGCISTGGGALYYLQLQSEKSQVTPSVSLAYKRFNAVLLL